MTLTTDRYHDLREKLQAPTAEFRRVRHEYEAFEVWRLFINGVKVEPARLNDSDYLAELVSRINSRERQS